MSNRDAKGRFAKGEPLLSEQERTFFKEVSIANQESGLFIQSPYMSHPTPTIQKAPSFFNLFAEGLLIFSLGFAAGCAFWYLLG